MKLSKIRPFVSAILFILLAAGLVFGLNFGTMSAFGPGDISALCPLGAFTTMIATKTLTARPIVSIIIMAVIVLLLGRVFCAWVCPVTFINNLKAFFRSPKARKAIEQQKHDEAIEIAKYEISCAHDCGSCSAGCKAEKRPRFDGRHGILIGALLSAAVFGFPVFCLICPVGLSFALVVLVWRMFAWGDVTVAVILVAAMLILEVFVLRKWCIRFCPLSALMNLASRFSRTFKPVIDNDKCLETAKGVPCSKCAQACEHGINLRHIEYGEHDLADCARCFACVDACPTHAISMPVAYKQQPFQLKSAAPEQARVSCVVEEPVAEGTEK